MIKDTKKALEDKNITLEITDEAKNYVLEKGTNLKFGARPLRRAIQKYIEDEISEKILKSEILDGQTVTVKLNNDTLEFC